MIKKNRNVHKTKGNFALIVMSALFLLFLVFYIFSVISSEKADKPDQLEGMPNYTEVKKKIVVNGFNYDKQPYLGSADAKIKVIEFGDFKCPACKQWHEGVFPELKRDFIDTGKIQFYFMNYAFIDRDSLLAASAGEAIYNQSNDLFWQYYEKLYDNQGPENEIWATQKYLLNFVKDNISGTDYNKFEEDLKKNTFFPDVKEDYKIGGFYGVNGSPIFFVNDKIIRTSDYSELSAQIEELLR